MTIEVELAGRVLAEIDRDELTQLACDLVNIPSPTGNEKVYNEMGIPAVKIGPRGRHRTPGPRGEEINIDTIVQAAQLYSLIALDICNRERPRAN